MASLLRFWQSLLRPPGASGPRFMAICCSRHLMQETAPSDLVLYSIKTNDWLPPGLSWRQKLPQTLSPRSSLSGRPLSLGNGKEIATHKLGRSPSPPQDRMDPKRSFCTSHVQEMVPVLSPLPDVMVLQESLLSPDPTGCLWPFPLFKEGYVSPPCKYLLCMRLFNSVCSYIYKMLV